MQYLNSLIIAFSTYSRIPMPNVDWKDENRKYAMCFFPLVGVVIGLALAVWLWFCDFVGVGALLRGAVGAAIPLFITGGIHMDGFMDVSDALASWQPIEKRLEILKDSHAGAFAVMKCALYLIVMAGVLGEATVKDALALGACFVVSRTLSALAATAFKSARSGGMLDGFARASQMKKVTISGIIYGIVCAIVWIASCGIVGTVCLDVAALCLVYYRRMAYKQFGGVTGDLAGWFLQVTELFLMLTIILGGKIA